MTLFLLMMVMPFFHPFVPPARASGITLTDTPFDRIREQARGTRVHWYMYGGWAHVNTWVDTFVAKEMKQRYDMDVKRVPMDAGVFVNKLLNEKAAGKESGTIDLLWINGENFKNAKQAGLLFGPFAGHLPNVRQYVDPDNITHDFGFPVDGFEAPFGRAQFVFEYDNARMDTPPDTVSTLKQWIVDNPGQFTYPQPPDFTGSAFVRHIFYAVTGGHEQYMAGWNRTCIKKCAAAVGMAQRHPAVPVAERKHLSQGQCIPGHPVCQGRGGSGHVLSPSPCPEYDHRRQLSGDCQNLCLERRAIFNTHFTAIPFNAPTRPEPWCWLIFWYPWMPRCQNLYRRTGGFSGSGSEPAQCIEPAAV